MPVPSAMNTTVAAPEAAPNRRSASAAAFTSCSTTTGRPSRSVIRSATGASRHARCGANRTPRRSGVTKPASASPTAPTRCRCASSVTTPATAASSASWLRGRRGAGGVDDLALRVDHPGPHAGAADVDADGQHDGPRSTAMCWTTCPGRDGAGSGPSAPSGERPPAARPSAPAACRAAAAPARRDAPCARRERRSRPGTRCTVLRRAPPASSGAASPRSVRHRAQHRRRSAHGRRRRPGTSSRPVAPAGGRARYEPVQHDGRAPRSSAARAAPRVRLARSCSRPVIAATARGPGGTPPAGRRRPAGRAVTVHRRSTAGSATSRRTPAAVTASSSPIRARSSGAVRGAGEVQRELELGVRGPAAARRPPHRQGRRRRPVGGGSSSPHSCAASAQQRADAGGLGRGVVDGAHRHVPRPRDVGQHGRLLGARARAASAPRHRAASAVGVGHEPVRDEPVDAQAVQRQRGERAAGLGGDHRSGVSTSRTPVPGVGEQGAQGGESSASGVEGLGGAVPARQRRAAARGARRAGPARRGGAPGTAAPGSRRSPRAGPAAAASRPSGRSRRRRRPTGRSRAARRTARSASSSSTPGSTVSSSATQLVHPGPGSTVPRCSRSGPHASSSRARASTCAANRPRLRRPRPARRPRSALQRVARGSARGRWTRPASCARTARGAAAVAAARVVLPTPPLPVNSTIRIAASVIAADRRGQAVSPPRGA